MTCDYRKALDLAKDGEWDDAHKLVQAYSDKMSCLIHGYLHRIEGDLSNARYWYRRAEETMPDNDLAAESKRLYELVEQSG